ncbi:hypothetical protein SSBG_06127 [Streptomyces sp. SPB074]|nr:hypothetical protein SSBG_06127 [Streptomyces sp. SPB074]
MRRPRRVQEVRTRDPRLYRTEPAMSPRARALWVLAAFLVLAATVAGVVRAGEPGPVLMPKRDAGP